MISVEHLLVPLLQLGLEPVPELVAPPAAFASPASAAFAPVADIDSVRALIASAPKVPSAAHQLMLSPGFGS